eukprot:3120666-Rhodomonas_salina.1
MPLDRCEHTADADTHPADSQAQAQAQAQLEATTQTHQALGKIAEVRALLQQSHDTCMKLHDEWAATQLELA